MRALRSNAPAGSSACREHLPISLGSGWAASPAGVPCPGRGGGERQRLLAAPASPVVAIPRAAGATVGCHPKGRTWLWERFPGLSLADLRCGGCAARWVHADSSAFGRALRVCLYAHPALVPHLCTYPHKHALEGLLENATH